MNRSQWRSRWLRSIRGTPFSKAGIALITNSAMG